MKIYIGADHAGYALKEKLKIFLAQKGHEVEDKGAFKLDPEDDYPDFIKPVAEAVAEDPDNRRGIVIGGSGQGEAVAANRLKGARAIVFYGTRLPIFPVDIKGKKSEDPFEIVRLSRAHDNANILSLGARFITIEEAKQAVEIFLETEFEGGRHSRRVKKIDGNQI